MLQCYNFIGLHCFPFSDIHQPTWDYLTCMYDWGDTWPRGGAGWRPVERVWGPCGPPAWCGAPRDCLARRGHAGWRPCARTSSSPGTAPSAAPGNRCSCNTVGTWHFNWVCLYNSVITYCKASFNYLIFFGGLILSNLMTCTCKINFETTHVKLSFILFKFCFPDISKTFSNI